MSSFSDLSLFSVDEEGCWMCGLSWGDPSGWRDVNMQTLTNYLTLTNSDNSLAVGCYGRRYREELSKVPILKPGLGQNMILHATSAARSLPHMLISKIQVYLQKQTNKQKHTQINNQKKEGGGGGEERERIGGKEGAFSAPAPQSSLFFSFFFFTALDGGWTNTQ